MDPNELLLLVSVAVAAGLSVLVLSWSLYLHFLVVIPPNRALVIFGRRAARRETRDLFGRSAKVDTARFVVGGRAFIPPWTQGCATLSLSTLDVDVPLHAVRVQGSESTARADVRVGLQVKIPSDPEGLRGAAENLLGRSDDQIRAVVRSIVEGHVPSVLARYPLEQLDTDREQLALEVQVLVAADLVPLGLTVQTLSFKDIGRTAPSAPSGLSLPGSTALTNADLDRTVWELSSRLRKLERKLDEVEHRTRTPEIHPLVPDLEGLGPRVTVARS